MIFRSDSSTTSNKNKMEFLKLMHTTSVSTNQTMVSGSVACMELIYLGHFCSDNLVVFTTIFPSVQWGVLVSSDSDFSSDKNDFSVQWVLLTPDLNGHSAALHKKLRYFYKNGKLVFGAFSRDWNWPRVTAALNQDKVCTAITVH